MIEIPVAVTHDTEPGPNHRHEARVQATCSACGLGYALCTVTDEAILLMLKRSWICRPCRQSGEWYA